MRAPPASIDAGVLEAQLRETRAGRQLLAGPPEAALALLVRDDRPVETGGVKIGPQGVGEVELGIGQLPQHEVADALLAAGPDEQIRLGSVVERQVRGEVALAEAS